MNQKTTQNVIQEAISVIKRPPVVVIMGHVDHGKTTLLDVIRKTSIASREAGGITQSIGAYEITHTQINADQDADKRGLNISVNQLSNQRESAISEGKKITFIDTPGHEAFSSMRSRGADVADLAILIVAADDGVQPQTKESIEILKQTNTPFIVAINKIDKPSADIEKVKNELTQNEVYLEGYGGNISWQKISAKSGEGVNELLDLILLAAELENLNYNPVAEFAEGFILEAKKDNQRGVCASVILKNGVLKSGDYIATKSVCGKIKLLENFRGEKVFQIEPSAPALILGFDELPQVGESFKAGSLDVEKIKSDQELNSQKNCLSILESGKNSLNVIIKADVSGSLEALSQIIKNLPQKDLVINVVDEKIGDITDNDIKLAISTNSLLVGFKTKTAKSAKSMAAANNVTIINSEIIYHLIKEIGDRIEKFHLPSVLGELEVLAIFNSQKKEKQVIGGKVVCGSIKNRTELKIIRDSLEIGTGKITNLQKAKQDAFEVKVGDECGVLFASDVLIQKGDILRNEIPPGEVK